MDFTRKILLLLCLLPCTILVNAQQTIVLSGKVLADDFGPMGNVGVYESHLAVGVFTDSTGAFKLNLPVGENEISFSYIGYRTEKMNLNLTRDTLIELKMKADLQLKEVVVVDKQKLKAASHDPDGVITLRKENFMSLPSLLGENDPIRAVEMQPGIQSGNEGATGIFVRGGSPDQNLILLDGAPVFNPAHIYGFISVFNGDAIDRIDIYKDAYPAQFGGRLSSVMDITSSDGASKPLTGSFALGVVSSRLHLEGAIDKLRKTTISVSARGSFIGAFTKPISEVQFKKEGFNGGISYYFEDVNAKLTHQFSNNDKLQFSFFENSDYYKLVRNDPYSGPGYNNAYNVIERTDWSNYVSSLVWSHLFGDKWQWKNTASFSDYIFKPSQENNSERIYTTPPYNDSRNFTGYFGVSYIRQFSLQSDAVYTPDAIQQLKFGAGANQQQFETGGGNATKQTGTNTFVTVTTPLQKEDVNPVEASAYVLDEIRPSAHWLINLGFHLQNYAVEGKDWFSFLPRANVVLTPVKNFSIRAAVSGVSQDLHLLSPSGSDVLDDYWVPATKSAPPESGWNYSLGVTQKLPLNFEWSIDGFYRSMKNLIDYKDGADYSFQQSNWEQQIVTGGIGKAYGLETYVARSFGRVTGSVAYTLAWSDRKFENLNFGNWFPYKYDRRHDVAAQLNFLVNKHIELGAAWVYGSGTMITLPVQNYITWGGANATQQNVLNGYSTPGTEEEVLASTTRNAYRLPSYQHLDLSFTYKTKIKKLEHIFNFSIYNVYNHFNVFEIYSLPTTSSTGASITVYKQLSLFPILPSVSYCIKFGV